MKNKDNYVSFMDFNNGISTVAIVKNMNLDMSAIERGAASYYTHENEGDGNRSYNRTFIAKSLDDVKTQSDVIGKLNSTSTEKERFRYSTLLKNMKNENLSHVVEGINNHHRALRKDDRVIDLGANLIFTM